MSIKLQLELGKLRDALARQGRLCPKCQTACSLLNVAPITWKCKSSKCALKFNDLKNNLEK